ncbi:MAG: glycosyltransferase [Candidatus Pelagibacter sp.]
MKIATLLPYKENYSPSFSGAVSIHVSNLYKYSKFKKNITIWGNTKSKKYLSTNYKNISINKSILSSSNKKYLSKFIDLQKNNEPDIIEIHNRPKYVAEIKDKLKSKIILYFHNSPLDISGSKSIKERKELLNKCEYIFFNSSWTKNQFFKDISEDMFVSKFGICFQSTKKINVNLKIKKNIITFVGKLNSAKGYDIFGKSIIKVLNEFPDWKSVVVGDEPREKLFFKHENLKIYSFKDNNFVLNLLKKSSISVACSRWDEPFGRTSLEACSVGCATIITNRGGLTETTKNPIILNNLNSDSLYELIKSLILNTEYRKKIQYLNYKSFFLTHEYVSKIIDKIRSRLIDNSIFNINKNSKLRILHVTNFNQRYFGRLQYNTGIRINNGLIREGHNVLSLSDRDLISYTKSIVDPSGSKYLNKLIKNTIENFKPNLIVLGHADRVKPETLLNAKQKISQLKICQWFLDPLSKKGPDYEKNKERLLDKNSICDTTFVTTSPDAIDFKIKNPYYMPNPCDKSLDYLTNFNNSHDFDIFYAISHGVHRGNLRYGKNDEREIFITKLRKKTKNIKFDTYGMYGVQPIWGEEFLNKLSNSKMALNLSRGQPVKYYSSDRIAQLMGNGLLTFIHKKTKFSDFFDKDEMIFYDDLTDLSNKIIKYSKDDIQRRKIAKKGHKKYHRHFNSSLVARYIIDRSLGISSKYYWE